MTEIEFAPIKLALAEYLDQEQKQLTFESKRLFHGRGGCFPGLEWCSIDAFAPVLLVTVYEAPPSVFEMLLVDAVISSKAFQFSTFTSIAIQFRCLPQSPMKWLLGEPQCDGLAKRGGLDFNIRFSNTNIGYFLDMEPGRIWLEERVATCSVLNLFAYTCTFSVIAHGAGAKKIVNVDMSSSALSIGRSNHHINGQATENVEFLALNILKSWSRIKKRGPYDIIIIDPPSFQKGSFVATKDYLKVIRRIPELAEPGAEILACLNAPELGSEFIVDLFNTHVPECVYQGRLPCSKDFQDVDPIRQLKLLHFRYLPV